MWHGTSLAKRQASGAPGRLAADIYYGRFDVPAADLDTGALSARRTSHPHSTGLAGQHGNVVVAVQHRQYTLAVVVDSCEFGGERGDGARILQLDADNRLFTLTGGMRRHRQTLLRQ